MDHKKIQLLGFLGYFKLSFTQITANLIKKLFPSFSIQVKLQMNGYKHPVWIRCGTSDYPCFHLIFIQEEFKEIIPLIPNSIDKMIDCGSNVGYTIKYFLERKETLTVIGIEPDLSNFKMAKKNLSYFGAKVKLLNQAVWSHPSYVKVVDGHYGNGGKWALTVVETHDQRDISAISLNELIQENEQFTYFVKMDVEGAEKIILSEQTQWMNQTALLSVELHDQDCEKVFNDFKLKHQLSYLGLYQEMHCVCNAKFMID